MTDIAVLPTLISVTTLNSTSIYHFEVYPPYPDAGPGGNISITDVGAAWGLGPKLQIPDRFPRSVELHLADGVHQISASQSASNFQYGRYKPFQDGFPYNLPIEYPVNITFTLAGDM